MEAKHEMSIKSIKDLNHDLREEKEVMGVEFKNMTAGKDKYMQELKDMKDDRDRKNKEKEYFQNDLKVTK